MTGPEHYREAERLLAIVAPIPATAEDAPANASIVAEAQAHATLALAAATALVSYRDNGMTEGDRSAWYRTASEHPEYYRRQRAGDAAELAEFATEPQS